MRRIRRGIPAFAMATAALLIGPVMQVEAWGSKGHRIIGHIARELLSSKARTALRDLMGTDDLATFGTYMDERKHEFEQRIPGSRRWHYDNIPVCTAQSSFAQYCVEGLCASAQISRHLQLLRDPRQPTTRRQFTLLVLTHLIGDVHQPLHAADNGDRGGNDIKVRLPDGRRLNLHATWDTALVERRFAGQNEIAVAKRLIRDYATRSVAWQRAALEEWMTESHRIAKERAYGALPGFTCGPGFDRGRILLTHAYLRQAEDVAEEQLARAGYQLANTLNLIFGP